MAVREEPSKGRESLQPDPLAILLAGAVHRNDEAAATRWLLQDANPNSRSFQSNHSLLVDACQRNAVAMVTLLMRHGCYINNTDESGSLALHMSLKYESWESAGAILDKSSVDLMAEDAQGWTALMWAAKKGHKEICKKILKQCPNCICPRDGVEQRQSALHVAAEFGHAELCEFLVEAGSEVDCVNGNGETPLLIACSASYLESVKVLLDCGADVTDPRLLFASLGGHKGVLELLLEAGAAVTERDGFGNTPLIEAARCGSLSDVSALLKYCPPAVIKMQNRSGKNAAHVAVEGDVLDILQLLLDNGLNDGIIDSGGQTAMIIAAQHGNEKAIEILVRARANVDTTDFVKKTALHWAVKRGHERCVCALLAAGAQVNIRDQRGGTSLHVAAHHGDIAIVALLLQAGAKVNTPTSKGDTPLHLVARQGGADIAEMLLKAGCDLRLRNSSSTTALHEACRHGHLDVVRLIICHGGAINQAETDGDTPLLLAASNGHAAVVEFLLKRGCMVEHRNEAQRTALLEAADHGHHEVIPLLVAHGADTATTDMEQDSALILASNKRNYRAVAALLKAGCSVNYCNRWGLSALHHVCCVWFQVHREDELPQLTVQLLLDAGAHPDCADSQGSTPLTMSVMSTRTAVVAALLRAGADPNKRGAGADSRAVCPIQIAVTKELFTIAQMLYFAGCSLTPVNVWMDTATGWRYMIPVKNLELRQWLETVTANAMPLKLICRSVIRSRLGRQATNKADLLGLPTIMAQYLKLTDIMARVVVDDVSNSFTMWRSTSTMTGSITDQDDMSQSWLSASSLSTSDFNY